MAGGCRQQGGAAPLPEGAGASDLLPEERFRPSGERGDHSEPPLPPFGVFPVWRRSSGGSGEAQEWQRLVPALWTCLQRGRDCLLLQVWTDPLIFCYKKAVTSIITQILIKYSCWGVGKLNLVLVIISTYLSYNTIVFRLSVRNTYLMSRSSQVSVWCSLSEPE